MEMENGFLSLKPFNIPSFTTELRALDFILLAAYIAIKII